MILVLAPAALAWGGWIAASVPGQAVSICTANGYLYVVGYAYDAQTWHHLLRIKTRDKASGQLVKDHAEPGDQVAVA